MNKKIALIKDQRGVGLIEVLVAVLILSTSLMALAALQMRSLQYNQSSYFESQANMLANDIIDRMRINRANYASYNITIFAAVSGAAIPATATPNAAADMDQWRRLIAASLPNGMGIATCPPVTPIVCSIKIRWSNINNVTGAGQGTANSVENASILSYSAGL